MHKVVVQAREQDIETGTVGSSEVEMHDLAWEERWDCGSGEVEASN